MANTCKFTSLFRVVVPLVLVQAFKATLAEPNIPDQQLQVGVLGADGSTHPIRQRRTTATLCVLHSFPHTRMIGGSWATTARLGMSARTYHSCLPQQLTGHL